MSGWIIALLILTGISVYIGIAVLFYVALRKIFKNEDEDDVACWAGMWIVFIPFVVLLSPIILFEKLTEMIDEDIEKQQRAKSYRKKGGGEE